METVEVVIRLPKEVYDETLENGFLQPIYGGVVAKCFEQGTVLPKGHGRLIDASQLLTVTECKEDGTEYCYIPYAHIEDAPTIIEADREVENADSD